MRESIDLSNSSNLRDSVNAASWQDEDELFDILVEKIDFSETDWQQVEDASAALIGQLRGETRAPLIDQFLTEYGLSNDEGVQLMRLAEALSRTTDPVTANQLIRDKLQGRDWLSHVSRGKGLLIRGTGLALFLIDKWLQWTGRQDRSHPSAWSLPGQAILRWCTRQAIRQLSSQFVFGESLQSALIRAEKYRRYGYLFSFDMLGEAARTDADAQKYYHAYADALDQVIAAAATDDARLNHGISVKLSALHPRYEFGQAGECVPEIVALLKPLAQKAKAAHVQITIDAEEAERLDISMDVLAALVTDPDLHGWHGLGFVVQAYQRRALPLIDWLRTQSVLLGAPLMIRLVKGAYWDSEIKRAQEMGLPSYPVFTRKEMTDASYLACARELLRHPDCFSPQFATHNAASVAAIRHMAPNDAQFEFQRLFGMGQQLHDVILSGHQIPSRIYAPVGTQKDLLSYLIRRLLENGANSSFVNKLVDPDIAIATLAKDPIAILEQAQTKANPAICQPRNYLGDERQSAEGWDLSNPWSATSFLPESPKPPLHRSKRGRSSKARWYIARPDQFPAQPMPHAQSEAVPIPNSLTWNPQ